MGRLPGFYLGFIIWRRSPEWPKATRFLGGPVTCCPGNFLKWICTEMQSGAFWDTILRNVTVCALTSSRLDDLFGYNYLYTVMIEIFFGGREESWAFFFLGWGGGGFYPSNTLPNNIWTSEHLFGVAGCPTVFSLKKQNKTKQKTNKTREVRQSNPRRVEYFHASGAMLFLRKIADYSFFSYRSIIQCMIKKFKCS